MVSAHPLVYSLVQGHAVIDWVQLNVLIFNGSPKGFDVNVVQSSSLSLHANLDFNFFRSKVTFRESDSQS